MSCNRCPICDMPKACYEEICYQCELKGLKANETDSKAS